MSESEFRMLVAEIESQIAASGPNERDRLRQHLAAVKEKAALGRRHYYRAKRAEQDRIDDAIEAQFDNLPV